MATETNPAKEPLVQMLLDRYQSQISSRISEYAAERGGNLAGAARELNYKKSTLADWKTKKNIPGWEAYFELMLNLKGVQSIEKAETINTLKNNLADFLSESMIEYRKREGLSRREFAERSGFSESSIYDWSNKNIVPKPKDFFKIMAVIYSDRQIDEIFRPISDIELLKQKKYLLISGETESLANLAAQASPDSKQNVKRIKEIMDELCSLVYYFRKADAKERENLRSECKEKMQMYGITLAEARQILRKEENYTGWLKMNRRE